MKMAANNRGNEHSDSSNQKYRSKNVAFGIIGTSFVGTIFLISPFITMQLRSPLPYMATPKRKVIDALENIAKRKNTQMKSQSLVNKNIKKKLRYYDLGSGDGEAVLAASSTGRWRATGIELNSTLWTVSSIRRMVASPAIRRHSNFVWGNMWDHKIYDADAVMIFGVKPLMPMIAGKINQECKPGTFVMSYRFLIPCIENAENDTAQKSNDQDKLDASLIYDKDEMRIYQLRSTGIKSS